MLVLGFADYRPQGQALADALAVPYREVDIHRFPDGESRVVVPCDLPERVLVCRALDHPNHKLVELMFTAVTAREQGAHHLTLVAPYLCYMRQDIAFTPGEAVSQRVVGRHLADLFDAVLTVDPHLHRIAALSEVMPDIHTEALSCAPAMVEYLRSHGGDPLLLGPDSESQQWVRAIAEPAGLDYGVAVKERFGDRQVETRLPDRDYPGREVILVDDMISTGGTMASVARQLVAAGTARVECLVTHALFADGAEELLRSAGIGRIASSDSVAHPTNAVPLAGLLAEATLRIFDRASDRVSGGAA